MGILENLFGRGPEPLPLDPAGPAAAPIAAQRVALEPFVRKIPEQVELVPAPDAIYAFFGRPPRAFGFAWFEGGREHGFKSVAEEQGLSQARIQALSARLGRAYRAHAGAERRSVDIAGKTVLVILADTLADEIRDAILAALA